MAVEDASYPLLQILLVFGLSEHLTDVDAVALCELAGGLPGSLRIEDPLHRVEYVAGILRRGQIGERFILVYHSDNLRHLGLKGLFWVLDLFDLFVALLSQIGQIVLEAYHAVVRGAIRALLDAILFGHLPGLILTLTEDVAKIIGRMALLLGKRTTLGIAQHVRKIGESRLYVSAVDLAMRKCH
jgi:hypothetical protein